MTIENNSSKKIAWAFNIAPWKRDYIASCFSDFELKYIAIRDSVARHDKRIKDSENCIFLVWGLSQPDDLEVYAAENNIPVIRMEDGFVRSNGLGANHILPSSICFDRTGIYFDSRKPSDLETMLQNFDFESSSDLMIQAERCMQLIINNKITKYNGLETNIASQLYGEKKSLRVLVLGQVEDDQSVIYGCDKKIDNNDVVRLAAKENPQAQIIYKVHPDVLAGKRSELSNPEDVSDIALIVRQPLSFDDALQGVDVVYTISSLGGFEALIRNISVITLGAPFYSGWGITEDRQNINRRNRKLTLLEVFACSYLMYAKYFNVETGMPTTLESVLNNLILEKEKSKANKNVDLRSEDRATQKYLYGFPYAAELLKQIVEGERIIVIDQEITPEAFGKLLNSKLQRADVELYVWGGRLPTNLRVLMKNFKGHQISVEPGFVHQLGLTPGAYAPFFWNIDSVGLSYDADKETDLIQSLNSYSTSGEIETANAEVKKHVLDKLESSVDLEQRERLLALIGEKTATRILVLGQLEGQPFTKQVGCKHYTGNDLVVIAFSENPGAQIIYRPDISNEKLNPKLSDPSAVKEMCVLVPSNTDTSLLIETCDVVYTITHIGGFEALLRGKSVTLFGSPFYSGWGLTDDRQPVSFRTKKFTIDQLFSASCLQYPTLVDPIYKKTFKSADVGEIWLSADRRFSQKSKQAEPADLTPAVGLDVGPVPTFIIGFSPWKPYMLHWFPERQMTFIDKRIKAVDFFKAYKDKILSDKNSEIFVWGFKMEPFIKRFIEKNNIKCYFIEDGFIRSVALGATKAPPYSLNMDSKTPYFDATKPSDLECLLNEYDFDSNPDLLTRADALMASLRDTGLSKYNNSKSVNIDEIYGIKEKQRVLVIGQVEDDASIEFGCNKKYTNNDVVLIAALENPDAHIIYKPHPDVLNGHRAKQSNPDDVRHICQVLDQDIPLSQAFETIDHVYTITSQAGLEALIRGIKVTTLGCPFYAGWGLTDERQPNPRRARNLTVREVFAASYILYPKYFDPIYKQAITAEKAVERLVKMRGMASLKRSNMGILDHISDKKKIEKYLYGFPYAAELLKQIVEGERIIVIDQEITPEAFGKLLNSKLQRADVELYVWGGRLPTNLRVLMKNFKGHQISVEPGFVHQLGLTPGAYAPFFWNIDSVGLSYDADKETDLIQSLNSYSTSGEIETANAEVKKHVLDKLESSVDLEQRERLLALIGEKTATRILVLGQLEGQPFTKQVGCKHYTGNDLVVIAFSENPGAQIIYRPDISNEKLNPKLSDPSAVKEMCVLVPSNTDTSLLIETCDVVYTITHIGGFEALLRGKSVTLFGSPFYSGWGLTDDRQPVSFRTKKFTIDQLFSASCLQYPTLVDPIYKKTFKSADVGEIWLSADRRFSQKSKQAEPADLTPAVGLDVGPVPTFIIGFSPWKPYMLHWFPERQMTFIDKRIKAVDFFKAYKDKILSDKNSEIFVWGFKMEPFIKRFIEKNNIKCYFIEDGFIRSVALGATKAPPYSLNMDSKTPYFDATKPSDLECLLNEYDFDSNPDLLTRADALMASLRDTGLSKYNNSKSVNIDEIYGIKEKQRVLVIGQVEDDASIEFGCNKKYTNNDVVLIAALENPDAHIIYKPHPDVLNGHRAKQSNPDDVRHICQVLDQDIPLSQAFETIDHVYTITSQAGLEALIRGIKVTTLGCPFYAGWGLTDERQPNPRRARNLTVREVFAASYILYPKYFDPIYKQAITAEKAVERLVKMKGMAAELPDPAATMDEIEAALECTVSAVEPPLSSEVSSTHILPPEFVEKGVEKHNQYRLMMLLAEAQVNISKIQNHIVEVVQGEADQVE